MTDADLDFMRSFVEERRWRFAHSMRWNPHEYTVRDWIPNETLTPELTPERAFDRFVELIYEHGFHGRWGRKLYPYFDLDGETYYTVGRPVGEEDVINRKWTQKVEGDRGSAPWNRLSDEERGER